MNLESFPDQSEITIESNEVLESRRIIETALQTAFDVHQSLGERGLERTNKNRFGENALLVDLEAERVVIEAIRQSGMPARVISEEHGEVLLADLPEYTVILDGLDGTQTYTESPGVGRYGTTLGMFKGNSPAYQDYLSSGVMEHGMRRLLLATRGEGIILRGEDGQVRPVRSSGKTELTPGIRFGVDEYWEYNRDYFLRKLEDYINVRNFSSESRYVDVSIGETDLALESTRKGNLEIAVAYGLIAEAGGVMVDKNGQSIGSKRYSAFGQDHHEPIITAATPELAAAVMKHLAQWKSNS